MLGGLDLSPIPNKANRSGVDDSLVSALTAAENSSGVGTSRLGRSAPESHTLTSLIAKISVLQQQVKAIESDKLSLTEQRDFALAEVARANQLLSTVSAEHHEVTSRVAELAKFREEHVCAASQDQYAELEALTRECRSTQLRRARKEEHLNAVLNATREEADTVRRLKDAGIGEVIHAASQSVSQDASLSYEQLLLLKTGEQAVALDRLRRAADDRERLDAEISRNEQEIKSLRALLENTGAPLPEAPQTHRSRRIINRMAARSLGGGSIGGGGASSSGTQLAAGPQRSDPSRIISVPVGTLRAIAARSGFSNVRALANAHGVQKLVVKVTDKNGTELHCEAPTLALDHFETAVRNCVAYDAALLERDGVLTGTDPAAALAVDQAVDELRDVLTAGKTSAKAVRFDTDHDMVSVDDSVTETSNVS